MSWIRARAALVELGANEADVTTVFAFIQQRAHDEHRGGMHTNGGCNGGQCDYGSPVCAAFTRVCEELSRFRRVPSDERSRSECGAVLMRRDAPASGPVPEPHPITEDGSALRTWPSLLTGRGPLY